MIFGGNVVKSDHWVILAHMEPLLIISGRYDVISKKKIKKIVISLLLVLEWFFPNKNIMIVEIIEYASKWWVTWPLLHYDLENDQLGQFIRNCIRTSGSMIRWSQKQFICNTCNNFTLNASIWGITWFFYFQFFSFVSWQ